MMCRACNIEQRPNSSNISRYDGGSQSTGWHADNDLLFDAKQHKACIVSLSLGASRTFKVRKIGDSQVAKALPLHHGSLCVTGGHVPKILQALGAEGTWYPKYEVQPNLEDNCLPSRAVQTMLLLSSQQNGQCAEGAGAKRLPAQFSPELPP